MEKLAGIPVIEPLYRKDGMPVFAVEEAWATRHSRGIIWWTYVAFADFDENKRPFLSVEDGTLDVIGLMIPSHELHKTPETISLAALCYDTGEKPTGSFSPANI